MGRVLIGSIVGGLIQFIIGAIAWASPLGRLAFNHATDAQAADLQVALSRNLAQTGTGTYFIPSPETAEGTVLLGKGPVALIMFNAGGFPPMNPTALLVGLAMSIAMMLLIGIALSLIDGYAKRMRALLLIAVATVMYFIFGLPVFNFYMPWDWWTYLGIESFIALLVGGWVMIRFFMPKDPATVPAVAPAAPAPDINPAATESAPQP